jgi:hypothetical protein
MKIRAALVALLAGMSMAPALHAQAPLEAKSKGSAEGPRPTDADLSKRIIDELSDEERQRFRAAVNQVWQAEEVKKRRQEMYEANLAYRRALKSAVQNVDAAPKVRAVLLRLMQLRFRQEAKAPEGAAPNASDRPAARPMWLPHSKEDQAILSAARLKAEKVPVVIAAKLKLDQAVTPRERNAAAGNFRVVMRAAMEAADPRVKRLFARRDRMAPNDRRRPAERR